ncbi:MAG TPA: tRNA lysidine(34) synthetase TilS, partial [Bryobacteraceae bacterium]|nr:tRNA lysidine(34) synthetase TilS [Bryobacteraceae bacterium]
LARDWNPAISETLATTADWAQGEEEYWEAEVARISSGVMRHTGRAVIVDAARLGGFPLAAARRLVRHACQLVKGDLRGLGFPHIEAILHLAKSTEGHGRLQAPGLDVIRSFHWLRFALPGSDTLENRNYGFPATPPAAFEIPGPGGSIRLELIEKQETSSSRDCVYNNGSDCLDWETVSGGLQLRNWRPGDRYQPASRSAEEKIKTFFQEERVPLWERRYWPVLADGSSIIWSRRFGASRRNAVHAATRMVLAIRDRGPDDSRPLSAGFRP